MVNAQASSVLVIRSLRALVMLAIYEAEVTSVRVACAERVHYSGGNAW